MTLRDREAFLWDMLQAAEEIQNYLIVWAIAQEELLRLRRDVERLLAETG